MKADIVITRLISIVSKPILIVVVVVVIDVVFVKKNVWPKKFCFKVQKRFRQKKIGSRRVRSKKIVVQKNFVQKIKDQKNFVSKKILCPKKFRVQKILDAKIFGKQIRL